MKQAIVTQSPTPAPVAEFLNKLVDRTYANWRSGDPARRYSAIVGCSRNAVLAVRVYVKLQNARGLPEDQTRKEFVVRLLRLQRLTARSRA